MLSNEEFRAVFDAYPDGCFVVGQDGRIQASNPRVEELFGWSPADLVGEGVEVLVPEALHDTHTRHRSRFVADPHNRPMGAGLELKGRRKDGSTFPVEISLSPWPRDDGSLLVICTVRDVTEFRRLQDFSEGAMRASEEERQRIARELHDDTAQRIATLILRVRGLATETSADKRMALLEQVRQELVDTAEGVKRMARGLRPPEIEELGLSLAITAHVRSLAEAADFPVRTELGSFEPRLGLTAKLALYRIVQEALSNARRHAHASLVVVRLFRAEEAVVLEVEDDGRGFDLGDAIEDPDGLGLIGMRERAAMIGGRVVIDSVPGEGTTVRVTVPTGPDEG